MQLPCFIRGESLELPCARRNKDDLLYLFVHVCGNVTCEYKQFLFLLDASMSFNTVPARYLALCGLILLGCTAPFLLNTHPPLYDYPFYIARIFILSELNTNPFLLEHYAISSFLIPNIGAELVLLPLTVFVPYEVAFDVFIFLIFTFILTGAIFLHYTLFGKLSLWPLITAAFLINWILLFGFLNYMLGVGMFLWGFAGWIRLSRKQPTFRSLYGALIASVLFFVHLVAFGLYAVAVVGFESQRMLTSPNTPNGRSVISFVRTLMPAAAQFIPPIVLFFLSPTKDSGVADSGSDSLKYDFLEKIFAPLVTLTSGNLWLDVLTGLTALILGALIFFFGRVTFARDVFLTLTALIVVYLALPHHMDPAAFVDSRIPVAILFVIIASLQISFDRPFAGVLATVVITCLISAKSAVLAQDWRRHDEVIREYSEAFDRIRDKSTLFVAAQQVPYSWTRKHYVWRMQSPQHVADLATLTGSIFVPSVFALSGQHTIKVREKFDPLKRYQGSDPIEIKDGQHFAEVIENLVALHKQVSPHRTAYLLLLDRGKPRIPLPRGVSLIESGSGFRLIEIGVGCCINYGIKSLNYQ